jgi:hypothetical protein
VDLGESLVEQSWSLFLISRHLMFIAHIGQVAQADGARTSVQRVSCVMTMLQYVSHMFRFAVAEDM